MHQLPTILTRSPSTYPVIDVRRQTDTVRIAMLEAEVLALRAEVEQSRLILDNAVEYAIVSLNLGGRITSWNAGASAIFGYSSAEMLGNSAELFFTQEDRERGVFINELCLALDQGRAMNERWHLRKDGSRFWASGVMLPLRNAAGEASGFLNIFCDRSSQQAETERRSLLQEETQHRMRNTLTVVHALAVQAVRQTASAEAFASVFDEHMRALARSHDLLTADSMQEALLRKVVDDGRATFGGHAERIHILSDTVFMLPGNAVSLLGLALHELGVNAVKHGALSTPVGWVEVSWSQAGQDTLEFVWRERNGPPASPFRQAGFGSKLLEHDLAQEFSGTVRISFEPDGLECRIGIPLSSEPRQ